MANRNRPTRVRFSHEKAIIFGVMLMVCGIAGIVLSAVAIAKKLWGHQMGSGVWSGALFVLCGCLGIAASRRRTVASIGAYMISSVFAMVGALAVLAISGLGIAYENQNAFKVVHILMMVVAVVAAFCAMVSSAVSCQATCGKANSPTKTRSPSGRSSPPISEMSLTTPIYRPSTGNSSEHDGVTSSDSRRHHRPERERGSSRSHPRSDRDRSRSDRPRSRPGHRERDNYDPPRLSERRLSTEPLHPALSGMNPPPVQQTQQITIVAPIVTPSTAASNMYNMPSGTYVMQTAGVGGFSQVMYVMPPTSQVAPPGGRAQSPVVDDDLFPPGTPPPSYSPLDPQLIQETLAQHQQDENNEQDGAQDDVQQDTPPLHTSSAPSSEQLQNLGAVGGDQMIDSTPEVTPPTSRMQSPRPPSHPPTPLPESVREQQIHRRTPLQTVL